MGRNCSNPLVGGGADTPPAPNNPPRPGGAIPGAYSTSSTAGRELGRGHVPQRAVRPVLVVILTPLPGQPLGCRQALKLLHRQKLVTEPTVEALGIAVLPRAARLNVKRFDVDLSKPSSDRLGHKRCGRTLAHPASQTARPGVDRILARDAAVHLQSQTLPRVLVDDRACSFFCRKSVASPRPSPHCTGDGYSLTRRMRSHKIGASVGLSYPLRRRGAVFELLGGKP